MMKRDRERVGDVGIERLGEGDEGMGGAGDMDVGREE